jgi:hypothetical protein
MGAFGREAAAPTLGALQLDLEEQYLFCLVFCRLDEPLSFSYSLVVCLLDPSPASCV